MSSVPGDEFGSEESFRWLRNWCFGLQTGNDSASFEVFSMRSDVAFSLRSDHTLAAAEFVAWLFATDASVLVNYTDDQIAQSLDFIFGLGLMNAVGDRRVSLDLRERILRGVAVFFRRAITPRIGGANDLDMHVDGVWSVCFPYEVAIEPHLCCVAFEVIEDLLRTEAEDSVNGLLRVLNRFHHYAPDHAALVIDRLLTSRKDLSEEFVAAARLAREGTLERW